MVCLWMDRLPAGMSSAYLCHSLSDFLEAHCFLAAEVLLGLAERPRRDSVPSRPPFHRVASDDLAQGEHLSVLSA